jgi:hypothetical protein
MEQRNSSARIVIDMKSKNNLVEETVLAFRIPYKLTKDQQEKAIKVYETNIF